MIVRVLIFFATVYLASCGPQPQPKSHTIHIKSMKFDPAVLTITKGDTVTWINDDMVDHDITEEAKKEWSSGALPTGKSWSKVMNSSADYFCSIHVVMKGKIQVN